MKVFLVRHGEGENSRTNWQFPLTPLNEKGQKQAQVLGNIPRFRDINQVLSSPWTRAQETAKIISQNLNKPLSVLDNLHERGQSSKIYGLSLSTPLAEQYSKDCFANRNDWNWKWDPEEESFVEVVRRAVEFKNYLINTYSQKSVLIVSHDVFLRCLMTSCILGGGQDEESFKKVFWSLNLDNTGISLLIYREEIKNWKLWYINDYAHMSLVQS
jgi:broad specificity phosphatase PhoE